MKRLAGRIILAIMVASAIPAWTGAQAEQVDRAPGTSARPMIVPLQPGVEITPLLNAGDRVGDDFQYTGVPDGIGVYRSADDRLEVLTNHEMSYLWGDPAFARVSHLTLDPTGAVLDGSYVVDGTEGYEYFCSSTLDLIDGHPWYFTGEEWIGTARGGISIAIDVLSGEVTETPQFGKMNHENVVPLHGLARAAMFLAEDSFRLRSQAYAYFAGSFADAIAGDGRFAVWVPDDRGDGDPSTDDIEKGDILSGRFVTIPHVERYTGLQLNAEAEALGSFNFVRIEDAANDPADPGVVYFADTGAKKSETKSGRLYRMSIDPAHPRRATLEVVLDGDAGDDIVNPDNLGISARALVIQEDRNDTASGFARIQVYDLASGTLAAVARLDPSEGAIERGGGPGVWESSGVVDVSDFFGPGTWLVNVQAHDTSILQQGIDLTVDSAKGERGQLALLTLPGT
jgi:hypothetical protein